LGPRKGNVFGLFDGVKIGDDGNGDPIVSADVMVAGKNDAGLTGIAAAELRGRTRANIGEIDSGVTGAR